MYKKTVLAVAIHSTSHNPVFGEGVSHITIEDDGAGPFVKITQSWDEDQAIRLEADELPLVFQAAQELLAQFPKEEL